MNRREYIVSESEARWWVTRGDDRAGPFLLQVDAVHHAVNAARADASSGMRARVMSHQYGGDNAVIFDTRDDI